MEVQFLWRIIEKLKLKAKRLSPLRENNQVRESSAILCLPCIGGSVWFNRFRLLGSFLYLTTFIPLFNGHSSPYPTFTLSQNDSLKTPEVRIRKRRKRNNKAIVFLKKWYDWSIATGVNVVLMTNFNLRSCGSESLID